MKQNSALSKIEGLQKFDRYLGAFIFGSFARGEQDRNSDLDIIVVVDKDNVCKEINHPVIDGLKLDISFRSLSQIRAESEDTVKKGERIPMIAESVIVFDKTGELGKLKRKFKNITPKKAGKKDFQFIHFMIYHADDKAKRNLSTDKTSALLAMGINLNEILKFHYQIWGHWWISNKRLLPDLRRWDNKLASLVEQFVITPEVKTKYEIWRQILDYVAKPIGGRKEIFEMNCDCANCRKDLKLLVPSRGVRIFGKIRHA